MYYGKFAPFAGALMLGVSALATNVKAAEDNIGVTAAVNPQASGQQPEQQRRELRVGVNVVANERIVTTAQGQAQMLFRDESAFTVGPNSDVVLDEFVYDPNTQTGKIALSATKGVFRLVGGKISKKTPVTLRTPTSTIGIRGGIALVAVQPDGSTQATFLFGDSMTVESGGVVKRATRPGFTIKTESADSPPSDPAPTSSEDLDAALSVLEGGLESEEDEDESGGESSQAANNSTEEEEESDEVASDEEGGTEEGGDSDEESETASDEGADDGATDDGGGDEGGGDEGGDTQLATDDGGDAGANDVPTDDDVASSDISSLGSDSEPEAIAPETDTSFEVAFADTTTTDTTDEIADDANITDTTSSSATDSLPEFTLGALFSGRIKHSSSAAAGSDDATPSLNLGFSDATIDDGVFDTAAGSGDFTINIDTGNGTATSTSNPFGSGILSGTYYLRADHEFVTYRLTDQTDGHRALAFAGVPTTTSPTAGATFYALASDFIMGSIVPFVPAASVGTATRTTGGTTSAIMWDDTQSATAQRAFGAAITAHNSSNPDSAVSVFIGEVKIGANGDYLAGKVRGSTRVGATADLHTISGAFETATDGDGASFFGDDSPDHFVLQATPGSSVTDETAAGSVSFNPNTVADRTNDTLATRTSHTDSTSTGLNGFAAGYVETDGASPGADFLFNFGGDPIDISVQTSAETNKVLAAFRLKTASGAVEYVYKFGDLDGGAFGGGASTSGNSIFVDDEHLGAVDRTTLSSTVGGTTVVDESTYMFSLDGAGPSSSVTECTCQFLEWGHWGGQLDSASNTDRVHLAFWVVGQMSTYSTIAGVSGTATYTGHAVGTVNNGGLVYQAAGSLSMTVDFGAPGNSSTSITGFDGGSFTGTGLTMSAAASGLAVFDNSAALVGSGGQAGRTATITGGFVAGGGDPAAEVAGKFTVAGTGYGAAGVIAGAK